LREQTDRQAVGFRLRGEVICAEGAAGSAHVLDHDGRMPGKMLAQVSGEEPPMQVERAAGVKCDEDAYRLAGKRRGC
jgi:hypothetical protein